jgi:hypothetical protein
MMVMMMMMMMYVLHGFGESGVESKISVKNPKG